MRKFDQSLTKVEPFYLGSEDSKVDAHMMNIDGKFRTGILEALDARVLELPYKVSLTCPFMRFFIFLSVFPTFFRLTN